jgi:hypothetical protein
MSIELWLQAVQTVAVVAGIIFAVIQLRQIRTQRELQAGVELLHPLQWPEMAETILRLHGIPDNLSGAELKPCLGDDFGSVLALLAMFESLGPLVARGHVPMGMYSEFYRGATVVCWTKLNRYVEEERSAGWPNLYEWAQWLAEQLAARSRSTPDKPAFVRFRDWRSTADYARLSSR